MYAVVKTGGKQYKAEVGRVLTVERLDVPQDFMVDRQDGPPQDRTAL